MSVIFFDKALQSRRGTSTDLALSEYVPAAGELVIATDTGEIRYGDGVNVWGKLKTCDNTKISNNLETVEAGEALDAVQGKVLNDRLRTLEGVRGIDCGEITLFIRIDRDETVPITDFYYYKNATATFTATWVTPPELEGRYPVWRVDGLPKGLTGTSARGVLTISGYAQESGTKAVTMSVSFGECSDTKVFTFSVAREGNSLAITNTSVGEWTIGVGSSVTLTSSVTGSISGTAKYYASGQPSWMSLNASTGVLSGTATGTATSGSIDAYVVKGNYRSPAKSLSYSKFEAIPKWSRSAITLDVTALARNSNQITEASINLGSLVAHDGSNGVTFSLSSDKILVARDATHKNTFDVRVRLEGQPLRPRLYIERPGRISNKNSYSSLSGDGAWLTMSNSYGSSWLYISLYIASSADYTSNSLKYASTVPIIMD